ncbi:MAG TPA: NAD(P)/FAD-dependent oxidoreductase [Solirubrobacteraceae bacterium]|nr:NAD(P)/FAD-dependent oxidoreductase [Solirubrobacteraceae bacterium]
MRVAIVGSGFGGIGMAVRLKRAGIDDFVVLERAGEVGGTWRDNSYPGCACDVPSHLYSFSFAPNPDWTRSYSPQAEILAYLRGVAEREGILPHVRTNHEVTETAWDEDAQRWRIAAGGEELEAQVLVVSAGPLSEPSIPKLPGLETFEGASFHSAAWDHSQPLDGRRVAVVGTGASAIQFVPQIQPEVDRLHLFMRTPPWIIPRDDRDISERERRVFRAFPPAQTMMRAGVFASREALVLGMMYPRAGKLIERRARKQLEEQVADPVLRERLTPSYQIGCKRILVSDDFYPSVGQPNVELVTGGIREVRARSIVSGDGVEREIDAIVFGTGFLTTDWPFAHRIRGRGGELLADRWRGGARAYLGTTIAGYPNLFLLYGPNTNLGHSSIVYMLESQANYVMDALRVMDEQGAASVELREQAQERFDREIQERLSTSVWNVGGCGSWYLDADGRNALMWPGTILRFRHRTRRFDPRPYVLRGGESGRAAVHPAEGVSAHTHA